MKITETRILAHIKPYLDGFPPGKKVKKIQFSEVCRNAHHYIWFRMVDPDGGKREQRLQYAGMKFLWKDLEVVWRVNWGMRTFEILQWRIEENKTTSHNGMFWRLVEQVLHYRASGRNDVDLWRKGVSVKFATDYKPKPWRKRERRKQLTLFLNDWLTTFTLAWENALTRKKSFWISCSTSKGSLSVQNHV